MHNQALSIHDNHIIYASIDNEMESEDEKDVRSGQESNPVPFSLKDSMPTTTLIRRSIKSSNLRRHRLHIIKNKNLHYFIINR